MKPKWKKWMISLFAAALLSSCCCLSAFAAGNGGVDIFKAGEEIIKDVYKQIVGISTILAGLMSAVAVIGAKMSNNQHTVDQSWSWLKRIWIAWAVINSIGGFIAYIVPLFDRAGMPGL